MKHRIGYKPLDRSSSHRKAMHRNMATSLLRYERVRTSLVKAREVRRTVEKLITRAKVDSVHNRRIVAKKIQDKEILAKLFVEIGPRFSERPGGYTRVLKLGRRPGDATEMAILELVERGEQTRRRKSEKKEAAPAPEEKEVETVEEEPETPEESAEEEAVEEETEAEEEAEEEEATEK